MQHRTLVLLTGFVLTLPTAAQGSLFVDPSAPPGGDGASWSSAFAELQDALDGARLDPSVQSIHVAAGTYRPDRGTLDASLSFELVDGVALLGGFPAGGGTLAERDPTAHPTTLTGDLAADDAPPDEAGWITGNDENSFHVVRAVGLGCGTQLDGFVVRAGNATAQGFGAGAGRGGNVYVEGGELVVRGCRLLRGYARDGGALAAVDAGVEVELCELAENRADNLGGGAAVLGTVAGVWRGCSFEANVGGAGAGLFVGPPTGFLGAGSPARIEGCSFRANRGVVGGTAGGGLAAAGSAVAVADCEFVANYANGGGGVYLSTSVGYVERCTFAGNLSEGDGGGALAVFDVQAALRAPTVVSSCALLGNSGGVLAVQASVELTGCTIADNVLAEQPIGLDWPAVLGQDASVLLANSIVWGNLDLGVFGDERDHLVSHTAFSTDFLVVNSIVEDWAGALPGSGLGVDPVFRDPLGPDGDGFTVLDNDYRLWGGSPAVDAGDDAAVPAQECCDVDGLPRFRDGDGDGAATVDLGAYESPARVPVTLDLASHP